MNNRTGWALVLVAILSVLVWASSQLAALRIYQVDECQNIYMASVLANGHASEFLTNASLFLFGPLSWLSRNATHSADVFQMARLVFLGVFWLNLLLMALIAGGQLYSLKTLLALVVAATLTPLWDYGFEIRHDNLVLTGVLLTWFVIRVKPIGAISYVVAGATAITLLFIAFKAVVYVLPLSLAILAFPPRSFAFSRMRLALAWIGGAVMATILIRICYGICGGWDIYLSAFHGVARYSAGAGAEGTRFAPWSTLARLPVQTPLLLAVAAGACVVIVLDFIRRGRAAIGWDGNMPEFLLMLGVLGGLAINPTPFPYNLIHVVPYVFLLVFRYTSGIWNEIWSLRSLRPVLVGVFVFAHLVPFEIATCRHKNYLNWRQERLMTLAEDLTNPACDRVFDGIGMVPSRMPVHYHWLLHSLNIQSFLNGSGPRVCDMLTTQPAAVFIPNYRTDWLSKEDHDFIRGRYVPVADDFWVLGKVLPAGGGTFEIYHDGRYRISTLKGSDLQDTYELGIKGAVAPEDPGTITAILDGKPLCNLPVQLSVGTHRIECSTNCEPAVVWMGPHRDRIHRIGPGDHRALFVNWY